MRLQNRRVLGAGVLALGAVLALAGCGAGQITQTATQQPAVNGTYSQVKLLELRNAALQFPPQGQAYASGQDARLTLTIINNGRQDDTLLSVSSPAAASATIGGSKVVVAGHSLVIGPDDAVESTNEVQATAAAPAPVTSGTPSSSSSSETPTGTATSSSSSSSETAPATPPGTQVPGGAGVKPGVGTIVLQGLKQPVWPGQNVPVTFVFKNSGPVTVEMPLAAPAHVPAAQG